MDLNEILRVDTNELVNFEPDIRIIVLMPEPENLKSKVGHRHLTHSRLQVTGCTVERYCILYVVVQGPGSLRSRLNFFVRRTVAELRGVKLAQFLDFGLCRRYTRFTECASSYFSATLWFCESESVLPFATEHRQRKAKFLTNDDRQQPPRTVRL